MGFLSKLHSAVTHLVEDPLKKIEQVDPVSIIASKVRGKPSGPATLISNQLHRDVRSKYGQAALPVAGGIIGTVFMGPGLGTGLGAAGGRAIAGAERGESDKGIVKNAAITGGTAYLGSQAGGLGQNYGGMAGRVAANTAASGATNASQQYAQTGRVNPNLVGMSMAGSAIGQGIGGGIRGYMSPNMPMTMPDTYDPSIAQQAQYANWAGAGAQTAAGYGFNKAVTEPYVKGLMQDQLTERMNAWQEQLRAIEGKTEEVTDQETSPYKQYSFLTDTQKQINKNLGQKRPWAVGE